MRESILKKLAQLHAEHPFRMLMIVIGLSIMFAIFATQLSITMRWSDLLPGNDHRTIEYNRIIREFKSASNIVVVVQGDEQRIKTFADTLAPRLLSVVDTSLNMTSRQAIRKLEKKLRQSGKTEDDPNVKKWRQQIAEYRSKIDFQVIQRVDYKLPIEFMKTHGLMLIKADDLKKNQLIFTDPNLPEFIRNMNDALEKTYVGQEESLSTREKEDQALVFLDGIQTLIIRLTACTQGESPDTKAVRQTIDQLLLGEPYFLSYDKSALILIAVPNFTAMEVDRMTGGTDAVHAALDSCLKSFPDVKAGLTGMIPIGRDEMVYGMKSANVTSVIAIVAILILLIFAFRMWVAPLFAILNLLIGILWAIGLTAMTVGSLNIMTQMMSVILLGLGIDFSIHFISGFTEQRAAGQSIESSLKATFLKYGKGIVTGALTTACAFLTLLVSSSRGMKEMGLVTGMGLLAVLVTTFLALPTFLVFRERRIDRRKNVRQIQRDISFRFLGRSGDYLGKHYLGTLLFALLLSLFLIWQAGQITFDQNYLHMEPKGLPSITLQDTISTKFDLSMDYALVLANSVEESRNLAKQYRTLSTTAMTEDIGLYLPSPEEQSRRKSYVEQIRARMVGSKIKTSLSRSDLGTLTKEIQRLAWNIMEIQDMAFLGGQDRVDKKCSELVGKTDGPKTNNMIMNLYESLKNSDDRVLNDLNRFQSRFAPRFKNQVLSMANAETIRLNMLPSSILDRYADQDRTHFLISVYPKASIWTDLAFLNQFVKDLDRVNDRATGMPTIFQALIEIVGQDGRKALVLTVLIVFLLLWADFRHAGHALIAMIPLLTGMAWMVGLMHLTGMQFTVVNVMGLPMILGIGIDDGVHIIHRWIYEGKRDLYTVFASTGKAILLTTLTTMLAFGSLFFSVWRGFASLGSALFLGVGACFVTTVLLLSGILGWIDHRQK
jgi:predicted RND superfamily exporter protein